MLHPGLCEALVPQDEAEPSWQLAAALLISRCVTAPDCQHLFALCRDAYKVCETVFSMKGLISQPNVLKQRWRRYYESRFTNIKSQWLSNLPGLDKLQAKLLKQALCRTTSEECIVDFADAGARSGYIAKRAHRRCSYLADILLTPEAALLRSQLFARASLRILNIGGGPGFDAVGLQLLSDFLGAQVNFTHAVLDIEAGWDHAVQMLNGSLQTVSAVARTKMSFSVGDLRWLDMQLCEDPRHVDVFILAYVCVENAESLRATGFAPLRRLFAVAAAGSVFAFLDSSDRLWPSILTVARDAGVFEATFVCTCGKVRMLLQRVGAVSASSLAKEASFVELCSAHAAAHNSRRR